MTSNITPDQYIFKFGKYNKMRAVDVAQIYEVDKDGNDVPKGLLYLKFLVQKCDWFRHKDIIEQIIKKYDNELNVDVDNESKKEIKKENKCKSVKIETNKVLNMS